MAKDDLIKEALENILNKNLKYKDMTPDYVSNKYKKLTGEDLQLDDIKEEIIDFIVSAKDSLSKFSEKTVEASFSLDSLSKSAKNIGFENIEKAFKTTISGSIDFIRTGYNKMSNVVLTSAKTMFLYSSGIIKNFFNDISKRTSSIIESIVSPIKNIMAMVLVPFKMIGSIFSGIKDIFSGGIKGLFGNLFSSDEDHEKDFDRAGITKKALSENLILKRTSIGVSIAWLWKQMSKSNFGSEEESGGFLNTAKDFALLGMASKGGLIATALGLLKKLAIAAPIIASVGAMGYDLFKKSKNYFNAKTPEEKRDAAEDLSGSALVSSGGMVIGGSIGFLLGGPLGAKIGASIGGGLASIFASDAFKKTVGKAWFKVVDAVSAGMSWIADKAISLWNALPTWEEFKTTVAEKYNTYIATPLANIRDDTINLFTGMIDGIKSLWDKASKWWDSFWADLNKRSDEFKTKDESKNKFLLPREIREAQAQEDRIALELGNKELIKEIQALKEKSPKNIVQDKNENFMDTIKEASEINSFTKMSSEKLYELMNNLAVSESDKEIIWNELNQRKLIDESINKSVAFFSEITVSLLKPLKEFTRQLELNNQYSLLNSAKTLFSGIARFFSGRTETQETDEKTHTVTLPTSGGAVSALKNFWTKTGAKVFSPTLKKSFNSIEEVLSSIITSSEGAYNSVNINDGKGGSSLGKAQWNANRARNILMKFRAKDKAEFDRLMGSNLTNALDTRKGNWSYFFSSKEVQGFKELMKRKDMQEIQDKQMLADASNYLQIAKKRGITDPKAQIFYADLMHQSGQDGANRRIGNLTDLDSMYRAVSGFYAGRRARVYKMLKELEIKPEKVQTPSIDLEKVSEVASDKYSDLKENLVSLTDKFTDGLKKIVENSKESIKDSKGSTTNITETGSPNLSTSVEQIPKLILNYMFGVNAGGDDTTNIFFS